MASQYTDEKDFREGPDRLWPRGRANEKSPTTEREQKKQGYFEIRRLKLIKLNASEVIGADIKTSEGEGRIELSQKNQLGFPEEGLYLYSGGDIVTSLSQNNIRFYDNTGTLRGLIAMNTAGRVTISAGSNIVAVTESGIEIGNGPVSFGGSSITMDSLPTSDPSVTGQIWNDSGTLKIST